MTIKVGSLVKPSNNNLAEKFGVGNVLFVHDGNYRNRYLVGFQKDSSDLHSGASGKSLFNGYKIPKEFKKRCYWFSVEDLVPMATETNDSKGQKIILWSEGNRVSAKDVYTGRVVTATCSPDDTFDFYKGANIALLRLIEHI